MSNNTSLTIREAGSLFLSEPYLLWLEKDVLPYIFGTICLLIILTSIIFNIAILKLFSNEGHVGIRRILHQFVAIDVLAAVFVLVPGMYISFSKLDDISAVYCHIIGVLNLTIYLIQFGMLSYGLLTSLIILRHNTHDTEYLARSKHAFSVISICVISFVFALIPLCWDDGFVSMTSEYLCGANRSYNKAYLNISFCIGVILSFSLTCIVSAAFIKRLLLKRKQVSSEIPNSPQENATLEDNLATSDKSEMSIIGRNRFKSDETVSIEDQTIPYVDIESRRNRFKSDITVSMEDHTRSYNDVHLKNSAQSGITVSMEDRTHSYITRFKSQGTETELDLFERKTDEPRLGVPVTSSNDSSMQSTLAILHNGEIGTFNSTKVYVNDTDTDSCNTSFGNNCRTPTDSIKDIPKSNPSQAESDDEISIEEAYVSRHDQHLESNAEKPPRIRISGNSLNVRVNKIEETRNPLTKLLRSSQMNNDMTVKFVTTNLVVSSCVIACWLPYLIMVYIEMYGTIWWSGWSTMALLCAYTSYCIKPLMILGVKGQLMKASKVVLPKSVENRTNRIASVLKSTMDKVSKRIY